MLAAQYQKTLEPAVVCRRRFERTVMRRPVRYIDAGAERFALTHDISDGGMFIVSSTLLPLGHRTKFGVRLEGGRDLSFTGTVIRTVRDATTGFAIRFETIAPDETAIVRRDIQREMLTVMQPPRRHLYAILAVSVLAVACGLAIAAHARGMSAGPALEPAGVAPETEPTIDFAPEPPLFVPEELFRDDPPSRSPRARRPRTSRPTASLAPPAPASPGPAAEHFAAGKALLRERKVLLALEQFEISLSHDANQPLAYRGIAAANYLLGREGAATRALERFMELAPAHSDVPRLRAYLEQKSRQ